MIYRFLYTPSTTEELPDLFCVDRVIDAENSTPAGLLPALQVDAVFTVERQFVRTVGTAGTISAKSQQIQAISVPAGQRGISFLLVLVGTCWNRFACASTIQSRYHPSTCVVLRVLQGKAVSEFCAN